MKIRKAFLYRLKTNDMSEQLFSQYSGCNRFLWNKSLALCKERLSKKHKMPYYNELAWYLTLWKQSEEYGFLTEAPSQTLQQTLKNLERAFKDCFNKKQPNKKFPVFKKKGLNESFRYPQGFKFDENRVFLPKIGWLKYYKSQDLVGSPKNVSVSKKGNHWYISVQVEYEVEQPSHSANSIIGIDRGVSFLAVTSENQFFLPSNSFKDNKSKLARLQKSLARKDKGSNNWKKQQQKIRQLHKKIADIRQDRLHWITTQLSKNHAIIVLEDLQIKNMSKSAKGSVESPGRMVKQKAGLNRSILDQGWGDFARMLEYKQRWNGGKVIYINPKNTSRSCPNCNHISKENRLTQKNFECVVCGYKENADFVAAKNILAAGHAVLAYGDIKPIAA